MLQHQQFMREKNAVEWALLLGRLPTRRVPADGSWLCTGVYWSAHQREECYLRQRQDCNGRSKDVQLNGVSESSDAGVARCVAPEPAGGAPLASFAAALASWYCSSLAELLWPVGTRWCLRVSWGGAPTYACVCWEPPGVTGPPPQCCLWTPARYVRLVFR
jgi:hypothetical protein